MVDRRGWIFIIMSSVYISELVEWVDIEFRDSLEKSILLKSRLKYNIFHYNIVLYRFTIPPLFVWVWDIQMEQSGLLEEFQQSKAKIEYKSAWEAGPKQLQSQQNFELSRNAMAKFS